MNKNLAEHFKNLSLIASASFIDAVMLNIKNSSEDDEFSEGDRPIITENDLKEMYQELAEIQNTPAEEYFNLFFNDAKSTGRCDGFIVKDLSDEELENFLIANAESDAREQLVYLRTQKIIDALMKKHFDYESGKEIAEKIGKNIDNGKNNNYCHLTDTQITEIANQLYKDNKFSISNLIARIQGKKSQPIDISQTLNKIGVGEQQEK